MSHEAARPAGEVLRYAAAEGQLGVSVYCEGETVWRTQKSMAALFGMKIPAIAKHLKDISDSGESLDSSVASNWEITASDGTSYETDREVDRLTGKDEQ